MPTLLLAAVLLLGIIVLSLAIYSNSATRTQYREGYASGSDMNRSSIHLALIAVAVVAGIALLSLLWSLADNLPSLDPAAEETITTAPATSEPAQEEE